MRTERVASQAYADSFKNQFKKISLEGKRQANQTMLQMVREMGRAQKLSQDFFELEKPKQQPSKQSSPHFNQIKDWLEKETKFMQDSQRSLRPIGSEIHLFSYDDESS